MVDARMLPGLYMRVLWPYIQHGVYLVLCGRMDAVVVHQSWTMQCMSTHVLCPQPTAGRHMLSRKVKHDDACQAYKQCIAAAYALENGSLSTAHV